MIFMISRKLYVWGIHCIIHSSQLHSYCSMHEWWENLPTFNCTLNKMCLNACFLCNNRLRKVTTKSYSKYSSTVEWQLPWNGNEIPKNDTLKHKFWFWKTYPKETVSTDYNKQNVTYKWTQLCDAIIKS